ncbi:MAG: hypothetical protein U5K84_10485 [Alkalibacterium sp.]|nr:hypothetical protein [Alkalibacterium sp.]
MISYFAELTEEGLLDIEAMTQDDEMARNKIVGLDTFVTSGNVGTMTDVNDSLAEQHGEGEYEYVRMPVLEGPNGRKFRGGNTNSGMMLNAKLAERDDFQAVLQFIDWLYYSDEGTDSLTGVSKVSLTKKLTKWQLDSDQWKISSTNDSMLVLKNKHAGRLRLR